MRARTWARIGLAAVVGASLFWAGWSWLRPRPALDPVLALLRAERTEEAQQRLRSLLAGDPTNLRAHLLLASIELDHLERVDRRDERLAREALEHARRVPTSDPALGIPARVTEAKLCGHLRKYDEAEAALKTALELDPTSDAGWVLLKLYDIQARRPEGRALATRLYHRHPKPHAKLALLTELVRQDVNQPAAAGLIAELGPVVEDNPGDLQSRLSLGRALSKEGLSDRGIPILRDAVRERPDLPAAWDALLSALEDAGKVDDLQVALTEARSRFNDEPRWARFAGWLRQERNDWCGAIAEYRRAREVDPRDTKVAYRLCRSLRLGGKQGEAGPIEARLRDHEAARRELRQVYESRKPELGGGMAPPALLQQIAELRERMGCRDEARGWHALVLRAKPDDPVSLAAVSRLK